MLTRQFTHRLLSPADVTPSHPDLEVIGVFNPAAAALPAPPQRPDGSIVLMARVAERPVDQRDGYHALPHWKPATSSDKALELVVEYLPQDQDTLVDPRKVVRAADQLMRLKFVSQVRSFELSRDGKTVLGELPPLDCRGPYETFGVEDARVTPIHNDDGGTTFWVTYVSVSEHGACTSLATTTDFQTYNRLGVCFAPENKDVMLCPERIDGKVVALHRPNTFQRFCKPEMWAATSADGKHWGEHRHVWSGRYAWDSDRIGAGTPPVVLDDDTLLEIYHGSEASTQKGKVGAYRAGLLALNRNKPWEVVAHTPEPVMQATEPWEQEGFVPDVVFPTGVVPPAPGSPGPTHAPLNDADHLLVFYGAADTHVGVTAFNVGEMKAALQP